MIGPAAGLPLACCWICCLSPEIAGTQNKKEPATLPAPKDTSSYFLQIPLNHPLLILNISIK